MARSRTRLRHRLLGLTAAYALLMIAISLGLSWQLRRTHDEIAEVVTSNVSRAQAIGELMPMLRRLSESWVAAADDPTFRPSMDAMSRIRDASQRQFASSNLPPGLRSGVLALSGQAERDAASWDDDDVSARLEKAARLNRAIQRLQRDAERERARNEQQLRIAIRDLRRTSDHASVVTLAIVYLVGIGALVVAQRALTRIIVPIERLSLAVDAVARGETTTRIPVGGDREIAHLGERFNEMTAALASSRAKLEELAHVDALTELPNFRTFRRRIDEEMERARRYETSFGLLILDLDRFKKYNDTYGHQAGNEALSSVAHALRITVRAVDFPARFGGEEFAVVAPECDREDLEALANRVRKAVAAIPPPEGRKALTVSIGGALFPGDGDDVEQLFATADQRLYAAKAAGRNRCIVEPVP